MNKCTKCNKEHTGNYMLCKECYMKEVKDPDRRVKAYNSKTFEVDFRKKIEIELWHIIAIAVGCFIAGAWIL